MGLDTTNAINNFFMADNGDGTYRIECLFVVYRELFGHHPSFLPQDEERGKREGFSTKFWFLVEDDIEPDKINNRLEFYKNTYSKQIFDIEKDDKKWESFPFKDKPVIYSK